MLLNKSILYHRLKLQTSEKNATEKVLKHITNYDIMFDIVCNLNVSHLTDINLWKEIDECKFDNMQKIKHEYILYLHKNNLTVKLTNSKILPNKLKQFINHNTCVDKAKLCITCTTASNNGHLECLRYTHENGCSWDEATCYFASMNGHLECLKYAHENGCPWNKYTCSDASGNGHLECLKYAHENGCPCPQFIIKLHKLKN